MIVVKMNLDIRKQETKLIANLTTRQVVALAIGALYAVPIAYYIPVEDIFYKIVIGLVSASPAIACGWIHKDGQYFEVLAIRYIVKKYLTPQYRKKTSSMYTKERRAIDKENEREREKEYLKSLSEKERKAYLKDKKKGIEVKYSRKKEDRLFR